MPSKKPRLALTVPDDLASDLSELAQLQGKPLATLVVDLLKEMRPQLQGLIKIQRAVKAGNVQAAKVALRHMVGDGMAELIAYQQPELFQAAKKGRRK